MPQLALLRNYLLKHYIAGLSPPQHLTIPNRVGVAPFLRCSTRRIFTGMSPSHTNLPEFERLINCTRANPLRVTGTQRASSPATPVSGAHAYSTIQSHHFLKSNKMNSTLNHSYHKDGTCSKELVPKPDRPVSVASGSPSTG